MKIILGDCLEETKKIEDKKFQLICIDPPYNINKEAWDSWGKAKKGYKPKEEDRTEEYYEWLGDLFVEAERTLKDNGTFAFFHNDFRAMAQLDLQIQKKTKLEQSNFIVWNKIFKGAKTEGFLRGYVQVENLNKFQKMAEYILIYNKNNFWKLKQEREIRGVKSSDISKEILSKNGNITGWYSNIETGKNYPTKETIIPIKKYLGLDLDDIVPKFRNQKTHHSVWDYEIVVNKGNHITEKPVDLLKNIILHYTDEGDSVYDCFAGSGSLGQAAMELNRDFFLVEKEEKYYNYIINRLGANK